MTRRTAILLSLGLNAALAAAAGWLARQPPASWSETFETKAITTRARENPEVAQIHSQPPETSARFHWHMIESVDYPVYVANLRAIGCPEPTLYDIIYADVSELYVRKRKALFEPLERQFWDLMASDKPQRGDDEWQMKYDALKEEKMKLLKVLLGDAQEPAAQKQGRAFPQPQLQFLSEEKQDQLGQLFAKYNRLRLEMQRQPGQTIGPEQRERLKALMQQQEADLKQLLTPEEYDEYKLRNSPAVHVVQNLYGFEPTEEESRAIARLRMDFEENQRKADPFAARDKRTILAARQQAQKRLDEQVKGVLGEARFDAFKRASDPRFQEIYRVAGRYGLPNEVAVRVYEIRDAAEHQADRLRQDTKLGEDQRQTALESIEEETERAIAENFGVSGLKTYKRYGGAWLDAMVELPDGGNAEDEIDRSK
jgi:hypothetical protein